MSGRAAPWTTAVLFALCVGLGAAVVFELTEGLSLAPEVTAASPSTPELDWSHEPVEFAPPARGEIDVIAERPLFSPSRRPFVVAQVGPEPAPAQPLPPLQLIGVLLTEQQRAALVQATGVGEPIWVREGSDVQGWRVERIERSHVDLRAGDRLETVELRADTAVPAQARPKPRRPQREQAPETAKGEGEQPAEATEAEAGSPDEPAN